MNYPCHVDTPISEAEARQMLSSTIPDRRQAARDYLWELHEQEQANAAIQQHIHDDPHASNNLVDTPIEQLIDFELIKLDSAIRAWAAVAGIVIFIIFL